MFDLSRLSRYPEKPGVYLMKDKQGRILYIGKAKDLKQRLKQYFTENGDTRPQIPHLLKKVSEIETIIVQTEKEAILLEARLIGKYKPKYNVLLKDDKSHIMIRVGLEHEWPRIELIRAKEKETVPPQAFGPFPAAYHARKLYDLVVRLFQLRQCSDEEFKRRTSYCLLYQMKRCSAPCVHLPSKEEYSKNVENACLFLSGKRSAFRKELVEKMHEASNNLEFEQANLYLERMKLLDAVSESEQVLRVLDTDVIGTWKEGKKLAISFLHYREGKMVWSSSYLVDCDLDLEPSSLLQRLILQYYLESSSFGTYPKEILVPMQIQKASLQEILDSELSKKMHVKTPLLGMKQDLLHLAEENARAKLQESSSLQEVRFQTLTELQRHFHLSSFPKVIDCFDASCFGGKDRVAACIGFLDGEKCTRRYRKFIIKAEDAHDDLSMLQEAVKRRYSHIGESDDLPDLILVDGGRNQLQAVLQAMKEISLLNVEVIAITKESGRHDKGLTTERFFTAHEEEPYELHPQAPLLFFLQTVRDEAHRFAIKFQQKRHKASITTVLETIPGIGSVKSKRLLMAFRGLKALKDASLEEIRKRANLSLSDAELVQEKLKDR